MDDAIRIIEINGVKVEVDLRTARKVDTFKVGDPVKILIKGYGDSFSISPGIIIGFDEFNARPSITVASLEISWNEANIKFHYINADSKDIEIAPYNEFEPQYSKAEAVAAFDRALQKKELELSELRQKKEFFLSQFGRFVKEREL